jgi:hypothetical protein
VREVERRAAVISARSLVTMTIYAHVSLEEKRKAMLKLGEALK